MERRQFKIHRMQSRELAAYTCRACQHPSGAALLPVEAKTHDPFVMAPH
jgi:hypothetical protein